MPDRDELLARAAHMSALVEKARWQWMLQFTMRTDHKVFGDHEIVIYTANPHTRILHQVNFKDPEEARLGYHRVLSLGARDVKTSRRIVSQSDWEDVAL